MDRRSALKNSALLAGISASGITLSSLLQSCQSQDRLDWQPSFFSESQAKTMSAMVDMMLPKTDTPGAIELKVDMFVDLMCHKHLSESDQTHVMAGFTAFEKKVQEDFGKKFSKLSKDEKVEVMKAIGASANTFNPSVWGSPLGEQAPLDFYRRVKQFTLMGYFTSEEVGKNILVYDPIPGDFKGCVPLDDVGNAWTI